MKITINLYQFKRKVKQFNYLIGFRLGELFQSYLTEEKRDYPRETIRQYGRGITGKVAGSLRDVVDSGKLVDSFFWESIVRGTIYKNIFIWDAEHALLVYLGWVSATGLQIPPWQWVHEALKEINWYAFLKRAWNDVN